MKNNTSFQSNNIKESMIKIQKDNNEIVFEESEIVKKIKKQAFFYLYINLFFILKSK
jgi:hypothetical protein